MTAPLRALVFDVDGTLADTEDAHRAAFNEAFDEAGLGWHWDHATYVRLLEVSGGRERIAHWWREVQPELTDIDADAIAATVQRVHDVKTAAYERRVRTGEVTLREGVAELLRDAHAEGVPLAIATTTSPVNVAALLAAALGPDWRLLFVAVEDASTAPRKKPHPQVYRQVLQRLGTAGAECVAFEDSANGLAAARGAGIPTLVTPNRFTAHQDFGAALGVLPSLAGVTLRDVRAWHAAACH